MVNKVILIGNITKDPEIKTLPSGSGVASFSLATNRTWKDKDGGKKEQAEYHNIVIFGGLSDVVSKYCKKGMKVYVEGRLQTRSWDDQNGVKKFRTEIIGENLSMLSRIEKDNTQEIKQELSDVTHETVQYDEESINIEDIPF